MFDIVRKCLVFQVSYKFHSYWFF